MSHVHHMLYFQACAVMALERVPADIRRQGGVARMTDPKVSFHVAELLHHINTYIRTYRHQHVLTLKFNSSAVNSKCLHVYRNNLRLTHTQGR